VHAEGGSEGHHAKNQIFNHWSVSGALAALAAVDWVSSLWRFPTAIGASALATASADMPGTFMRARVPGIGLLYGFMPHFPVSGCWISPRRSVEPGRRTVLVRDE
ncbi:hypothetical protein ACV2Y1_30060, partial [Klebsiella pneumoniae]